MHVRSLAAASLLAALGASAAGCYVVPAAPPPTDYQPVAAYTPPPPTPEPYYTPAPVYTQPPPDYGYQPQPTPPQTVAVVVYYEQPAPQPIEYYEPNVVWYYGPHPITPGWGYGWCPIQGPHAHEYEPYWNYVYSFYNGYYFYAGDPSPYGYSDVVYYYYDYHPNPWGGWCYIRGPHHHYYAPARAQATYYQYGNDHVYTYHGSYDATFYTEKAHYQPDGRPVSNQSAYTQHQQFRQTHNVMPVNFHPTVPIHSQMHPADAHVGGEPGHDEHNQIDGLGHQPDNHVEPGHGEPGHGPVWTPPANNDNNNNDRGNPREPDHVMTPGHEPDHGPANDGHVMMPGNGGNPHDDGHGPAMNGGHEPAGHEPAGHEPAGHEPAGHVEPGHEPAGHVGPGNGHEPPKNEPKNEPKNDGKGGAIGIPRPVASPTPTPAKGIHPR